MNPKQQLQKLIDDLKTKKFREGEAKGLMSSIQEEQTKALQPVLESMASTIADRAAEMFKEKIGELKIDAPSVEMPEISIDTETISNAIREAVSGVSINVQQPVVNVPEIKFPQIPTPVVNVPDRVLGDVNLMGVDNMKPLPVVLMGENGKKFQFPSASLGAGGGKADFFTIKGFEKSAFSELMNPDGRIKVELPTGSSGLTDTELRASSVPVAQASGAIWSTSVIDIFGSTSASGVFNGDNRIKVSVETGGSGLTDSELRASAVPVSQVSGAAWSTFLTGASATIGTVTINPDGNPVYGGTSSGGTVQVQDSLGSSITSFGSGDSKGLAVAIVDASGNQITSFGGGTQYADGATGSIPTGTVMFGDTGEESGNLYALAIASGVTNSSTLRTVQATDSISSVNIVSATSLTVTGVTNSIAVVQLDRDGNPQAEYAVGPVLSGLNETNGDVLRVVQMTDAVTSVNIMAVGTALETRQISGAVDSVSVVGPIAQGDEATALRVVVAGNSGVSVTATQTGTWNIGTVTTVTGITNSVASAVVDSSGVMYGSANPFHIAVHDSVGSTITSFGSGDSKGLAVAIVDASGNQITSFGGGTQYAEGATASTYTGTAMIFAEASSDAAKVVSSVDPLPATLATALSSSIDSILARPIKLRGSLTTAYATLNSNAETTLISASSGFYQDLVWLKFSNTSTGAVTIDLRDSSGGNIVDTWEVPANAPVGISIPVPYPQGNIGNAWTVDFNDADISNTTIYVSAMFSKET